MSDNGVSIGVVVLVIDDKLYHVHRTLQPIGYGLSTYTGYVVHNGDWFCALGSHKNIEDLMDDAEARIRELL